MADAPVGRGRIAFAPRWILSVALGETCGFAVATGTAVLAVVLGVADGWRLLLAVCAGAVEGAALALGQYAAMERDRPALGAWVGATAAAAALAWLLGMLPSTLGLPFTPVMIVPIVVGGLVLLASIPIAQWLVLRRPRSFRWVPITMGAWLVALLWTAAPSPLVDEQSPAGLIAALYVVAGVLMAFTVAALTLPVARSLFAR